MDNTTDIVLNSLIDSFENRVCWIERKRTSLSREILFRETVVLDTLLCAIVGAMLKAHIDTTPYDDRINSICERFNECCEELE